MSDPDLHVIREEQDGSAYDRARDLIDLAEEEGVGFVYVGPAAREGVSGTAIITPVENAAQIIMVLERALEAIKSTLD